MISGLIIVTRWFTLSFPLTACAWCDPELQQQQIQIIRARDSIIVYHVQSLKMTPKYMLHSNPSVSYLLDTSRVQLVDGDGVRVYQKPHICSSV